MGGRGYSKRPAPGEALAGPSAPHLTAAMPVWNERISA